MSNFKVKFVDGHEVFEIQSKRKSECADAIAPLIRFLEAGDYTYYELENWVHDFTEAYNAMMQRKLDKIEADKNSLVTGFEMSYND